MRPEIPAIPELPELREVPDAPRLTPPAPPTRPELPRYSLGQRIGHFVGRSLSVGFLSLLFMALGVLLVFVWPRQTKRVANCIAALPLQSFGLGLLTFLMAIALEVVAVFLMVIVVMVAAVLMGTVILIPIGLLLILLSVLILLPIPLALAGAMILGWVGLAEIVGEKVLKLFGMNNVASLGAAIVGILVTVPLAGLLWIISPFCCAWPFIILLTSVGVGAVIHTRFGSQPCLQSGSFEQPEPLPMKSMAEEIGRPDGPMSRAP